MKRLKRSQGFANRVLIRDLNAPKANGADKVAAFHDSNVDAWVAFLCIIPGRQIGQLKIR